MRVGNTAALELDQVGENACLVDWEAVEPLRGATMRDDWQDKFGLMTTATADLAQLRRRIVYVEAALAQLLGDREQLREWFSASELAAMALPGLPTTRQEVGQLASSQAWRTKIMVGRHGVRRLYHFDALPLCAFNGLIRAVMRAATGPGSATAETVDAPIATSTEHDKITPSWVLPLIRIMRNNNLPLDAALSRLPEHILHSVTCPNSDMARGVLAALGLLREAE